MLLNFVVLVRIFISICIYTLEIITNIFGLKLRNLVKFLIFVNMLYYLFVINLQMFEKIL